MPQLPLSDVFDWLPPKGVGMLAFLHHDGRYEIELHTCCSEWELTRQPPSAAALHALFDDAARTILAERDAIHARQPNPCATEAHLDAELDRANEAFRQGVALARGGMTP